MLITPEMVSSLVRKRFNRRKPSPQWANPIIEINAREHLYSTVLLTSAQLGRLVRHLCHAALCGAVEDIMAFPFVDRIKRGPLGRPSIPPLMRRAVFERDGAICRRCGTDDDLQLDHIKAWAFGGKTEMRNLQVLCGPCNRKKGPTAYARQRGAA